MPTRITLIVTGLALAAATLAAAALDAASGTGALAQDAVTEDEIRRLEQLEVTAILARDRETLRALWDSAYVVNSPDNQVAVAGNDPTDRPVMQKARVSMTRTAEKITFRGDFAIAMGSETIVPGEGQPRVGQTVRRRYTNVWMKQATGWKLVARHANVICADTAATRPPAAP